MWVKLKVDYSKQHKDEDGRPWVDHKAGEVIEITDEIGAANLVKNNKAVQVDEPVKPKVKKIKKGKKNGDSD